MKIAVLSGKGGTGKTFAAVNLAAVIHDAVYADCDVEEPNGYIFFQSDEVFSETVSVRNPSVDQARCIQCRSCVVFCRFNALAAVGGKIRVFESICHSCGGCSLVCPVQAISEVDRAVGTVTSLKSGQTHVWAGEMNVGEVSGVPLIKALLKRINQPDAGVVILDCPPGSSCTVIECVQEADYALLVAEPTLFGLHNLEMVYRLIQKFRIPCGVVINKTLEFADDPVFNFCERHAIPVLLKIPYDPQWGKWIGDGKIASHCSESCRSIFAALAEKILQEAAS